MRWQFILVDYNTDSAGDQTILPDEPIGWDELTIEVKRDQSSHGVFFDSSVNKLGFHGIGFSILSNAYATYGLNAEIDLVINIACDDNDPFQEFYTGRIIMTDYSEEYGDMCIASASVEQKSCLRTLINRIDQKINILDSETLDGSPVANYDALGTEITLESKPLRFIDSAVIENEDPITSTNVDSTSGEHLRGILFSGQIRKDYDSFAPDINNYGDGLPILITDSLGDIDCNDNRITIRVELEIDATAQLTGSGSVTNIVQFRVTLHHRDSNGTPLSQALLDVDFVELGDLLPHTVRLSVAQDSFYSISAGDQFYLTFSWAGTVGLFIYDVTAEFISGRFVATIESNCDPTPCKVFLINEALARTAEHLTDGCITCYSDFFGRFDSEPFSAEGDGCGGLLSITSGLHIRRANKTDGTEPALFTSFKDMIAALNAVYCIGWGTETGWAYGTDPVIRVEPVRFFYPEAVILTIDSPNKIETNIIDGLAYGSCQIGYNKWNSESVGGNDDLHSSREYRTELKANRNGLKQLSEFIASPYSIESTRRVGPGSEDYQYDDDVFFVCLDRQYSGFVPEVFNNLTTQNILSPQNIYNLRITPWRNLLRWYKILRTRRSDDLFFNSGKANFIARTYITSPVEDCLLEAQATLTSENADISFLTFKGGLAEEYTPIWLPESIEFEAPLSFAQYQIIKANPKGKIRVIQGSRTLSGWIDTLTWKPNKGNAKFKLRRSWT